MKPKCVQRLEAREERLEARGSVFSGSSYSSENPGPKPPPPTEDGTAKMESSYTQESSTTTYAEDSGGSNGPYTYGGFHFSEKGGKGASRIARDVFSTASGDDSSSAGGGLARLVDLKKFGELKDSVH